MTIKNESKNKNNENQNQDLFEIEILEEINIPSFNEISWVFNNNKHASASTTTLPGAKCLYLAVRCEDSVLGVIGIYLDKTAIDDFENNLLMAILNEGAMALEKEASNSKKREVEIKANQEELRANLLRSISHDLRTPLTSISGNAGVLLDSADKLSNERKIEIYSDIYFIEN